SSASESLRTGRHLRARVPNVLRDASGTRLAIFTRRRRGHEFCRYLESIMSNPPRPAKIYRSKCRKFAACVTAVTLFALCLFAPAQPSARAQTTVGSTGLVISQVYTRGGEPGAAFQNDYVEVFNRGTSSVDMNNWSL